jgi:cytochrome c5
MIRKYLAAAVLTLSGISPAMSQSVMVFKPVKVQLPAGGQTFPGGNEAVAISSNCLTCHSAGMILNQPALSKAAWSTEVHKMITVYKAPVSAQDADAVIAYLAKFKGKP